MGTARLFDERRRTDGVEKSQDIGKVNPPKDRQHATLRSRK